MRDVTTPICPLPGLGHCVRERCNFWDLDREECTCDCFEALEPEGGGSPGNLDAPCLMPYYEDYD
jgi:hypothetical protein